MILGKNNRFSFLPVVGLILVAGLLSFWSYIFVDPNLILISKPWWLEIQQWFWQYLGQWQLLSLQFTFLVFSWFALYFRGAQKGSAVTPTSLLGFCFIIFILWLGHNALSHDIFNYLFNAKMLIEYGADPHIRTALEFSYDPWVRFMHNIHTPAPYGYGWTVLSLVPYFLGFGSFLLAYLALKAWMVLGLVLYLLFGWVLVQRRKFLDWNERFWLFALNPLLLWETVLNGHNDVWMMWPALACFAILSNKKRLWWQIVLACVLLGFSISIKLVTVVLVPLAIFMILWPLLRKKVLLVSQFLGRLGEHGNRFWAEYAAIALLIPLATDRSQQFLSWYLIWPWAFFPLIQWKWLRMLLLAFSATSLLRYLPWLVNGLEYTDAVQLQMRLVTWSAVGIAAIIWAVSRFYQSRK